MTPQSCNEKPILRKMEFDSGGFCFVNGGNQPIIGIRKSIKVEFISYSNLH